MVVVAMVRRPWLLGIGGVYRSSTTTAGRSWVAARRGRAVVQKILAPVCAVVDSIDGYQLSRIE